MGKCQSLFAVLKWEDFGTFPFLGVCVILYFDILYVIMKTFKYKKANRAVRKADQKKIYRLGRGAARVGNGKMLKYFCSFRAK